MFLTIFKLESRMKRLAEKKYAYHQSLFPLTGYEDLRQKDLVVSAPEILSDEPIVLEKNTLIVGRDRYIWTEKSVLIPPALDGFETILYFDFGFTSQGYTAGFEATLYLDGVAFQGVDMHHKQVHIPAQYAGKTVQVKLCIWTGLLDQEAKFDATVHIKTANVGYLHTITERFYYLIDGICKTYHLLDDNDPTRAKLLALANKAMLSIDLYGDDDAFYSEVTTAHQTLLAELEAMDKQAPITVYCIGHSHIDVAWLWRLKHTKEKCLRTFSTVMRLMEDYPEYIFTQSQPQLYQYVKDNYPDLYQKIKEKVACGKFEPNGGMWVEADCNLISGESMVRQFLYGDKFFNQEFGIRSNCLWLPDVFGYSHAMPQVLKKSGIDVFMTTKISWNEYNKIPHDTFLWRGMDGTEILTHFITTPTEHKADHYSFFTYNGTVEPSSVKGVWDNYADKELTDEVAISFGWGDGGGGPTKEMLTKIDLLDKIPGLPQVKNLSSAEYFRKLQKNVAESDGYLHTFAEELYFENHRGTYTSQAYSKKTNRKLEYALQQQETLDVLAGFAGGASQQSTLEDAWKIVLLHQFHDIIPGSSIQDVYKDSHVNYARCQALLDEVTAVHDGALITPQAHAYTLFNATGFARQELVLLPETANGVFKDADGNLLTSDKTADGYAVLVTIKPMAFATIYFEAGDSDATNTCFTVSGKTIETPIYRVMFDDNGAMISLFDKQNNREVLKGVGNVLTAYEDIPILYDAWNLDYDHFLKYETVTNLTDFTVIQDGELSLTVRMQYAYRNSTICQDVVLYRDNRRIDFVTTADWHECHKFLKASFDVNIFANRATYDIQFGNVQRTTHHSTSWDWAKFEVCAHKWADFSEYGYGVSLLNDCKYGHSIKDSTMNISLIKSATWPDPDADQGEHRFTYALLPHVGDFRQGGVQQQAEFLNNDILLWQGTCAFADKSLFAIDVDHLSIDAVKFAEDGTGIILRVHEYMGGRSAFTIQSEFSMRSYQEVNLLEDVQGETVIDHKICDTITPYEIKSYKIVF